MLGFTYNGFHSSDMKVGYIPDANERGDHYADYEIIDEGRTWTPGGEYFHTRVKTRVFEISCYYYGITIREKERIIRWLDRRTSGELIFDARPYASYFVRPTKKIDFKDYLVEGCGGRLYAGTFSIELSAYDPFARLLYDHSDATASEQMLEETGLLDAEYAVPPVSVTDSHFLIYNPGTETGHSIIRFSGNTGSGDFTITNTANGSKCTLKQGIFTDGTDYIEIDSKRGRVEKVSYDSRERYFYAHDDGYITFETGMPICREADIQTSAGSRDITSASGDFLPEMEGQYVFLDGGWRYIGTIISTSHATLNVPIAKSLSVTAPIVAMNYMTLSKAADANITRLEVLCRAEVR